jgi:hypothetical protein
MRFTAIPLLLVFAMTGWAHADIDAIHLLFEETLDPLVQRRTFL